MSDLEANVEGESCDKEQAAKEQQLLDREPTLQMELGISLKGFADESCARDLGNCILSYLWYFEQVVQSRATLWRHCRLGLCYRADRN
jgi:hypothetical protein